MARTSVAPLATPPRAPDRARARRFSAAAAGRLRHGAMRKSLAVRASSDAASDGDASIDGRDWRTFRAALVAAHRGNDALAASARAGEGTRWAHALEAVERGALLVAVDEDTRSFWSHVVILILDHAAHGSTGVILNRTQSWTLAKHCPEFLDREGSYWDALAQDVVGVGGPVGLGGARDRSIIALSPKPQVGMTEEIVPGIHRVINLEQLTKLNSKLTGKGVLSPRDLSLFVGYSGWAPGQLQSEIDAGFWNVASASGGFIQDCMFKHVMDTIIDPNGKRIPIDAHGFQAWASMRQTLGM